MWKKVLCNVIGFTIFHLQKQPLDELVSFSIKLQTGATASNLSRVFCWRFRIYFISTEKWDEKREIPWWSSNIYFEYRFVWRQRFQINFWQIVNWSETVFKKNLMLQYSWLEEFRQGKSFWVVNTGRAPVRKRFKGSTINFANTFLTDYCTKLCARFY